MKILRKKSFFIVLLGIFVLSSSTQAEQTGETKFEDLNAYDIKQAEKIIRGTAQSMGIEISE